MAKPNNGKHQKTNASGSLQVSRHEAVVGIPKFVAAVFVSGDTPRYQRLPQKNVFIVGHDFKPGQNGHSRLREKIDLILTVCSFTVQSHLDKNIILEQIKCINFTKI